MGVKFIRRREEVEKLRRVGDEEGMGVGVGVLNAEALRRGGRAKYFRFSGREISFVN